MRRPTRTCSSAVPAKGHELILEIFGSDLELGVLGVATGAVEVAKVDAQLVMLLAVRRRQPVQRVVACIFNSISLHTSELLTKSTIPKHTMATHTYA